MAPTTLISGGTLVSANGMFEGDLLIEGERIAALLGPGGEHRADRVVDVSGCFVLPGLVDNHTHLALEFGGVPSADDFDSGTRAAAAGGTTCIVDFAFQTNGSLLEGIEAWKQKAAGRAHVDYGFHVVTSEPTPEALDEIEVAVAEGVTSFKLFMAYEGLRLSDGDLLQVLERVAEHGALPMVHAENDGAAVWLQEREVARGNVAPRFHAVTRPPTIEAEATGRVIRLAELVDSPLFVVHVTCAGALAEVDRARAAGLPVFAETCTHYLTLDVGELSRPGFEGAKFVCAPPLRSAPDREALWSGLGRQALQAVSTDHCSYNYTQKELGKDDFRRIPFGLPTIEMRLAVLYTEGVRTGRITLPDLVRLTSTAPAQLFGLAPRKGSLAPGADADIVVIDPDRVVTASASTHRMNVDYNPYEGRRLYGMPLSVMARGDLVVEDGEVISSPGRGRFVQRAAPWYPKRKESPHA